MSLQPSFSNTYEDNTDSLAGGLSSIAAPTPVPAPAPASVASLPSYENAYSAFGGKDATDSLATQFRSMGLSEDTIGSIFSPYYQTATTNTVAAPVTPAVNNYTNTQAVVEPDQILGGLAQGLDTTTTTTTTTPEYQPQQVESTAQAVTPSNVLSGNILAGASWNSLNPTLADELTQYTGQPTLNTAVGGATTADTLQQLNDFMSAGGSFAPGANVFLQTGGLDLVYGMDRDTIQNNIDQIVSILGDQGVNVVLTGSPYAASFEDVQSNNFNPELDSIYSNIASNRPNVSLVNSMGSILQNKDLLSDFIHPNAQGWQMYNRSVIDALTALNNRNRTTEQG
jgi:hypothetical protein